MASTLRRCGTVVLAALAIGAATACATMHVSSHLEPGVNFRQYRTYAWAPPDTWTTGDPRLDNNRFFDERVRARVERELARLGFEKATAPEPDLLVHYHASVSQEIDVLDIDPAKPYCADGDCRPLIYDKGTLIVDLVEPRADRLLWRGWAEGGIDGVIDNQAWMESRIDEAVTKIFKRLPARL
jgi:hypothetical protein